MVDLSNPTQIVEMLAPWSADRCDGESRFAPSAPAVADLDCSPEDKAEFFAKVLIEKVVMGMLEKGEEKARDLLGLADALKGALDQDARLALCSALRMMVDPDPRSVEECSCLSSVRKLISGDQEIGFPVICVAMPWASTARIGSRARHSSKRIASGTWRMRLPSGLPSTPSRQLAA